MKKLWFLIFIVFIDVNLFAQYTNIRIDNIGSPEEPTICINPKHTNIILAGCNIYNYYYSYDTGYTWTKGSLISESYGVWGDPCIIVDTNSNFYYFHLSNPPDGHWIDRIVCQKTTDAGLTWNDGTHTGVDGDSEQDKEWAIVDRNNNYIYTTWTHFDNYGSTNNSDSSFIKFSKSTDQGQTWSSPVRISKVAGDCIDDDNTTEGAVPAVGPDGEIYVSWMGPEGLLFDRSEDYGETWLDEDIFVADVPGGWAFDVPGISRCNGFPVTCCDVSNSNYNGTVYINWSDQRNGEDDTDVWLAKSNDKGNTWSSPIRVNNDSLGKHQFFNWMTIDQSNGNIYIVFYDRRNHEDNYTDVYLAVSYDGGETFQNIKISQTAFNPSHQVFFGDYNNITAHNGIIRPIWTRAEGTSLSIWTAIINEPIATAIEEPSFVDLSLELEQNSPNPFDENTYIRFKLYAESNINLIIYDQTGRVAAKIIDNTNMKPGKYLFSVNAKTYNLSPGIYSYQLLTKDSSVQKKMMIIN